MTSIIQFKIFKDEDIYVAEGFDLPIVTQGDDLDSLVKNIEEAVSLHFEGEDLKNLNFTPRSSTLVNFELSQYA
ncbi:MAG: HicB family protein [Candidatus Harrisonbacteria bacterium CG10_big_fil_rev_8_21_14_0_10_45_28]|uniref:HicB family protein n=1 Tax=Candidatus Harrisonbacteria bacterium CG10_big_fil_rev_8_21_14_0_10_45_28 TaxID=1974586 RepID=A0A2H0UMC7_9BACT|nr:MAG: HicB family protein [Candidatus Harrisonbacteria bacterium CG10_big_fil_rev_8_21_14_0_10_45_28]